MLKKRLQEMSTEIDKHGWALSGADAKPRLKWSRQLHQSFVDAVSQLGGADKATPKSVMRIMGIPGITLYHLKSHLQKYRIAKNRDHTAHNRYEDIMPAGYRSMENAISPTEEDKTQLQLHNPGTMLQLQMEVQRKLQEQIEVQKHLQLRIEAQGKYLQSVLRKAQETLASYNLNSMEVEAAKDELSELVSAVDTDCSSFSHRSCSFPDEQIRNADCSTDSCLTSSDRPKQHTFEATAESNEINHRHSEKNETESGDLSDIGAERIRSNAHSVAFHEEIDLNR